MRLKRHIGRRVAGVGVGVALLVLGLQAPAFAALTVGGFSPASGPAGCVVVVTGTDFNNPNVTEVRFNGATGTLAPDFAIQSATELWVTVPAAAANGPIYVENSAGQSAVSTTGFTVTSPGDCAPTVTSFTPTCGPAGTDVTITGTNLLKSTALGGSVQFAPYPALPGGAATPVAGAAVSPTQISVNVPAGSADGPIKVTTFTTTGGTVTSTATFDFGTCITEIKPTSGAVGSTVTITGVGLQGATAVTFAGEGGTRVQAIFTVATNTETTDTITATVPVGAIDGPIQVVAPGGTASSAAFDVTGGPPEGIARTVTLTLRKHLVAKGAVSAPDLAACAASVPVKIQRRTSSGWKGAGSTTTSDTGAYRVKLRDKPGKYRARAKPVTLATGENCLGATSPIRRHRH